MRGNRRQRADVGDVLSPVARRRRRPRAGNFRRTAHHPASATVPARYKSYVNPCRTLDLTLNAECGVGVEAVHRDQTERLTIREESLILHQLHLPRIAQHTFIAITCDFIRVRIMPPCRTSTRFPVEFGASENEPERVHGIDVVLPCNLRQAEGSRANSTSFRPSTQRLTKCSLRSPSGYISTAPAADLRCRRGTAACKFSHHVASTAPVPHRATEDELNHSREEWSWSQMRSCARPPPLLLSCPAVRCRIASWRHCVDQHSCAL